jgi:hypothetical protein
MCGVCGCFLKLKTKVMEEYCPENRWNDIKLHEDSGIALKNLTTDKATLEVTAGGFSLDYGVIYKGDNTTLKLIMINDRGNLETIPSSELDLGGIRFKSTCGCTVPSKPPEKLLEGEYFEFEIKYNAKLPMKFEQKVTFISDKVTLKITIKGEVKAK